MVDTLAVGLATALALAIVLVAYRWTGGFVRHALAQREGTKENPQPFRGYRDAILGELAARIRTLAAWPRALLHDPPSPHHDPEQGPPIVLVPDAHLPWTTLAPIRALLTGNGFTNVHILDTRGIGGSLDRFGEQVRARLVAITEQAGSQAIVVGHGAAGLALRWAIDHGEAHRVGHLVTIGTPHAGTKTPDRFARSLADDLVPGARALSNLDEDLLIASTAIFSHLDDAIHPAHSAWWGDQGIAVPGVGHLGLVWNERSTKIVLAAAVASIADPGGAEAAG